MIYDPNDYHDKVLLSDITESSKFLDVFGLNCRILVVDVRMSTTFTNCNIIAVYYQNPRYCLNNSFIDCNKNIKIYIQKEKNKNDYDVYSILINNLNSSKSISYYGVDYMKKDLYLYSTYTNIFEYHGEKSLDYIRITLL